MPFYNNVYYPFPSETPGTSAGIPSLLNSPQSLRSCSLPQHSSGASGPAITGMTEAHFPAFKFRARRESVDWRRISAIDVDRVASELDFHTLQENIMGITFCSVDNERCPYCQNPVEPVLLKLFRLLQLTVEYLLHSQEYLTSGVHAVEGKLQASVQEKEQIQKEATKQAEEIKLLKEELKRRKKIITSQQTMINAGVSNYHKCQHCDKAFMNYSFLQSHIQRRHPEEYDIVISEKQKKLQSVKFQEEINKLKEQLNLTRSQLENEHQAYMVKLSQEQQHQRTKEEETVKRFEKWKEEEKHKLDGEIEKMRDMFIREFKELSAKNAVLENQLSEMKMSNLQLKSNVGALQEVKAHETEEEEHRNYQELQNLKERFNKQEARWTTRVQKMRDEYEKEKKQLQADLHQMRSSLAEEQKLSSSFYRKKMEELGQKVQEQNKLITTQKEQMKQLSSKRPERTVELPVSVTVAEPVKAKSHTYDSASISVKDDKQLLISALKKNPSLTKELRPILEQTLVEKLEYLGVKPGVSGLSTDYYNKIMCQMSSQKQKSAKKFQDFHSVRETLINKVDLKVQEKRAASDSAVPKKRPENQKRNRSWSLPSARVTHVVSKAGLKGQPPQPAPRTKTNTVPKTSTPRTPPFSSDEESEEEFLQKPRPEPKAVLPKNPPVGFTETVVKNLESESDWTDDSEIEELEPQPLHRHKDQKEAAGKPVQSAAVKDVKQPGTQRDQKKLAGAVKVLPEQNDVLQKLKFSDADDDDWDISSLEEDKPTTVKLDKCQPVFSVRKSFESNSSYTSVWGTSTGRGHKGGFHEGDTVSTLKSSLVSVSDWSESSDN
ncbi:cilium assembly protein DZIP1 isoform X2 [Amia ocellicauda]|uniref:cilium assembly protein DZIP1 isoform X2 n=1 Tax=Amia ocellicauda TaxID=2972642 RepID=UPI0034642650